MDILHLVDRLEEVFRQSVRFPLTPIRLVDERRLEALVEQMRISIPEEVRRAQRVGQEREQILAEARERAEQLIRRAEERAAELAGEHAIARAAETRAVAIREKAERDAEILRSEADEYVFTTLCQLEEGLQRTLHVVENGLRKVQGERAATGDSPQG